MIDLKANLYEIIIGAWLHDIGKFIQRTGNNKFKKTELEGQLCTINKNGWYGHVHVLHSYGFIETYKDVFPEGINYSVIAKLAGSHHNPSDSDDHIISKADRMSSSSDRRIDENLEYEKSGSFYKQPLINLISTIQIPGKHKPTTKYLALKALKNESIIGIDDNIVSKELYSELWIKFEEDFIKLKNLNKEQFLESLEALMEQYTWCIPSSTIDDPDISLFDHSRTTVSFATALWHYHNETNTYKKEYIINRNDKKFILINGDMSGIQKYLFSLKTTKYNAKVLRARSFILEEQTNSIAEDIVKNTTIAKTSVLINAAGKFIVLLPNTKKTLKYIDKIREEIELYFMNTYIGTLTFQISEPVYLSFNELTQENAINIINILQSKTEKAKYSKLSTALKNTGYVFDKEYKKMKANGLCPVCYLRAARGSDPCNICSMEIKTGELLPKTNFIIERYDNIQDDCNIFNNHLSFQKELSNDNNPNLIFSINDFIPGYGLYHSPYYVPKRDDGSIKTFSDIANESVKGINKLAMFKADIDNLGLVFEKSLSERFSLSRYAALSRTLHYFFSSYLHSFLTSNPIFKNIYIIFSGGDDLCAIGPWDVLIDFVISFHKKFIEFTGGNESVTLSGGISIFNSNIPVRIMARMTEEQLDIAKYTEDIKQNEYSKNKISIFDLPITWQQFADNINFGKEMSKMLDENKISTSMVYSLIKFSKDHEQVLSGNVSKLLWKSHFSYLIHRNIEDNYTLEWFKQFGTEEKIIPSKIAASYALYSQRKGGKHA